MKRFPSFLAVAAMLLFMIGCGKPQIGIADNGLRPCPDSPNCVNSKADEPKHQIEPIPYDGDRQQAEQAMIRAIQSLPRCSVNAVEQGYIHAECNSLIFRFTDDLEFLFMPDRRLIHVRSASRTGYSDFGVNRDRVEEIRKLFTSEMTKHP